MTVDVHHDGRVGTAVVPPWVVPPEERVRLARRRAGSWFDSSGGEARYAGITHALDWIAGVRPDAPVTEAAEPAAPGQALVEVLAAEQALGREPRRSPGAAPRSAVGDERQMERLGRGVHVAARGSAGRLRDADIRFLDGALDTLRWLLGEVDRPPVALPVSD